MIQQEKGKIIANIELAPGFYHMTMEAPRIASLAQPGQFAEIRVSDSLDPLLRRPISFFDYGDGFVQFIFRVVGTGTEIMANKVAGETLDILGPLGTGFALQDFHEKKVIVLGGGMGIVPLYPLIKQLMHLQVEFEVLNGARCKQELILIDKFESMNIGYSLITNDGSAVRKGLITDLLQERLITGEIDYIYACGPHPMLRALAGIVKGYGVPCQVSIEEKMACGLGACLGCVVQTLGGNYKKVCKDGPVFLSDEIVW